MFSVKNLKWMYLKLDECIRSFEVISNNFHFGEQPKGGKLLLQITMKNIVWHIRGKTRNEKACRGEGTLKIWYWFDRRR